MFLDVDLIIISESMKSEIRTTSSLFCGGDSYFRIHEFRDKVTEFLRDKVTEFLRDKVTEFLRDKVTEFFAELPVFHFQNL